MRADAPRPVRPGEELPAAPLVGWLERHLGLAGPLTVEQFPGGHSNLTYLLRIGGRELVLRRPPAGSRVATAHDMGREFRVLSGLHPVYPQAPRPLAACDDPEVLGAPFYLVERVEGIILRQPRLPAGLEIPAGRMREISRAAVDGLAALHAVDYRAAGLGGLGRPEGYVERQVAGWGERWQRAQTDGVPALDRTAAWLLEHRPEETGAALIHNDYKYDNLVLDPLDPTRIMAVLDWEMATVGDPWMDLGTSLAYWIDPEDGPAAERLPTGPTTAPGNLNRLEVVERYVTQSGRTARDPLFYYVFGLFKVAVIAQQIYYRYRQGLTADPRFAGLLDAVRLLGAMAARAIELRRIDRLG